MTIARAKVFKRASLFKPMGARTAMSTSVASPVKKGSRQKKNDKRWGDSLPNPFEGKPLPFDKVLFQRDWWEEALKHGHGWADRDRHCKWHDSYFMEEMEQAYEADLSHPYKDLLYPWDDDYQQKCDQLEMLITMMKSVPDLQPFIKELQDEFQLFHITCTEQLKLKVQELTIKDDSTKGAAAMREAAGETVEWDAEPSKNDTVADWIHKFQDLVDEEWVRQEIDKHDYVRLQFLDAAGKKYLVYGMVGENLLETCRRWEVPIDGLCGGGDKLEIYGEGAMCYWCQVDLAPTYWHLIPPMPYTELHHHYHMRTHTPTSRLACQVFVQKDLDGMLVSIPHNNPSVNGRDGGYWN